MLVSVCSKLFGYKLRRFLEGNSSLSASYIIIGKCLWNTNWYLFPFKTNLFVKGNSVWTCRRVDIAKTDMSKPRSFEVNISVYQYFKVPYKRFNSSESTYGNSDNVGAKLSMPTFWLKQSISVRFPRTNELTTPLGLCKVVLLQKVKNGCPK